MSCWCFAVSNTLDTANYNKVQSSIVTEISGSYAYIFYLAILHMHRLDLKKTVSQTIAWMLHRERKRLRDMEKERNFSSAGKSLTWSILAVALSTSPCTLFSLCLFLQLTKCHPNITVSLSFSVVKHRNPGQSDLKVRSFWRSQSGRTIFSTEHISKILDYCFLFFLSPKSIVLQSLSSYLGYCMKDFRQLDFWWASSNSQECS